MIRRSASRWRTDRDFPGFMALSALPRGAGAGRPGRFRPRRSSPGRGLGNRRSSSAGRGMGAGAFEGLGAFLAASPAAAAAGCAVPQRLAGIHLEFRHGIHLGHQGGLQGLCFEHEVEVLLAVPGIGPVAAAQLEVHLIEIRGVDMQADVEAVAELVAGRAIGFPAPFGIRLVQFPAVLRHVDVAGSHLPDGNDVGIAAAPVAARGQDEAVLLPVKVQLAAPETKAAAGVEIGYPGEVVFPVGQVLPDLFRGGPAPVGDKGRQLFRALFAHMAVFQLPLAQKAELFAADDAFLLIEQLVKKSHRIPPRIKCMESVTHYTGPKGECQ